MKALRRHYCRFSNSFVTLTVEKSQSSVILLFTWFFFKMGLVPDTDMTWPWPRGDPRMLKGAKTRQLLWIWIWNRNAICRFVFKLVSCGGRQRHEQIRLIRWMKRRKATFATVAFCQVKTALCELVWLIDWSNSHTRQCIIAIIAAKVWWIQTQPFKPGAVSNRHMSVEIVGRPGNWLILLVNFQKSGRTMKLFRGKWLNF